MRLDSVFRHLLGVKFPSVPTDAQTLRKHDRPARRRGVRARQSAPVPALHQQAPNQGRRAAIRGIRRACRAWRHGHSGARRSSALRARRRRARARRYACTAAARALACLIARARAHVRAILSLRRAPRGS